MAQIILTIPTQYVPRVVDALKTKHPEYGNPESLLTDNQMAKEAVRLWIIHAVRTTERKTAVDDINIVVPEDVVTGELNPPPQ